MKVIINNCYGGFRWPRELENKACDEYDCFDFTHDKALRSNPELVRLVEEWLKDHPDGKSSSYSELRIVEIPDEATDWTINDYDGAEDVVYVLDGKMHVL